VIRIIHVSDTHLGFDHPIHPRVNKARRGEDFFNNFATVLRYATENKADYLVHGGDLFYRSRVPAGISNRTYQMLNGIAGTGIKVLIVPGNHERANLPASLFLADSNIHVFDQPRSFVFSKDVHRFSFCGFPYQKDNIRDNFRIILEKTGWRQPDCAARFLCLHQVIEGAVVGPNDFRFNGTGPQNIASADIPQGITAVLAGHIHRAQILHGNGTSGRHRVPIIYSGSTERTSSAERKELKGFYDIVIRLDSRGNITCKEIDFVVLPARPMVDIHIPPYMIEAELLKFIKEQIRDLDPRSIVYFKCRKENKMTKSVVPRERLLRNIMPREMIGKLTRSCFV
jgi:exonuclease SbcD